MEDCKICGIYTITNTENGKVYVGSSKDVHKRWDEHQKQLESKRHHNAKLQHAWNKTKGLPLEYAVVEECDGDILLEREQVWMDELDSYKSGYNCSSKAAYPTSKIKTSLKVKYEKEMEEICDNLISFYLRKDEFPEDLFFSFFGTDAGKSGTPSGFIKRYLKATRMCHDIVDEIKYLDTSIEYRLHYIHYTGAEASFTFSPEHNDKKNSKYSQHNSRKRKDLHSELWKDMMRWLKGNGVIGEVRKRFKFMMEDLGYDV